MASLKSKKANLVENVVDVIELIASNVAGNQDKMTSNSAIINLTDEDLQFTESTGPGGRGTTHTFNQAPDSALDQDDDDDKVGLLQTDAEGNPIRVNKYNFWSIEFYQQFFDVDTTEVKDRLIASMVPKPNRSFTSDVLRQKPDLWGPFWICSTLVISVAVSGNLASYFQTALSESKEFRWHYDFHKVTLAASAVFSYACLVPSGLYAFLWWTASSSLSVLSYLDLICMYGYSMTIYVPVSILWLIQNSAVQWILVIVGTALSGGVIVLTLWPVFKENKGGVVLIVVIVALHLLLATGFMLYFFHVPGDAAAASPSNETRSEKDLPQPDLPKDNNSNEKSGSGEKVDTSKESKREVQDRSNDPANIDDGKGDTDSMLEQQPPKPVERKDETDQELEAVKKS